MSDEWVSISKEIEFDAGHRIPRHNGKCFYPHGHRYRVVVACRGRIIDDPERSDNGMLVDFGELKSIMMKRIHDVLDHKFMVAREDQILLEWWPHPLKDGIMVFPYVPTAENIARWCWEQIIDDINGLWQDDLELVAVGVYETPTSMAEYNG